jgi:hypothetical protein
MHESENDIFREIISQVEVREGVGELQSLEDVKEAMLTSLFDHLAAFEDVDVNDEDAHAEACIMLTDHVGYDFEQIEGLDYGDEVVSVDELVLLVVDMTEGTTETFILDSSAELRGDVRDIMVGTSPDINAALDRSIDYDPETYPGPVIPFGVGLVLRNVSISHDEDEREFLPVSKLVFIPMGFTPFPMKKVA